MKLLKGYKLILACALLAGTGVGLSTSLAETATGVEAAGASGQYRYFIEGTISAPGDNTEIGWKDPNATGVPDLYEATWKDESVRNLV